MDEKLLKALAEEMKNAGTSPHGRSAFAEMLVELTEPGHLALETFNAFMPTTTANAGDVLVKRVRRGRYAVQSMVPGTAHLVSQVTFQDTHQWTFDRLVAGVRESTWNLRAGSLVTVESLRSQLRADVIDSVVGKVFNLLTTVWNSTDTPSNYAQTAALTDSTLKAIFENVTEKAGGVRAIVGTRRALLPIYEFAGFREYTPTAGTVAGFDLPEVLLEYFRSGRIASYKGAPLIELGQVYRNTLPGLRNKMVPDDKIVVIGQDAGEIKLYEDFQYQDYTDMTVQPADYVLHGWQSYGLMVEDPEMIGVIKLG